MVHITGSELNANTRLINQVTTTKLGTKTVLDTQSLYLNLIPNIQVKSTDANVCYIGYALPGTATSAALWQIMEVDSTTGTIGLFADGNLNFDNVFDNRESLSYS